MRKIAASIALAYSLSFFAQPAMQMPVLELEAVNLLSDFNVADPTVQAIYRVGGEDLDTYYYIEIDMPVCLTDVDGGTIRLIMQHEVNTLDEVRLADLQIAAELEDDSFGRRGRQTGRFGHTSPSMGEDRQWILGDEAPHIIASPWDWATIVDFKWMEGGEVLEGDRIRIYSHPHVTTRVIIKDNSAKQDTGVGLWSRPVRRPPD